MEETKKSPKSENRKYTVRKRGIKNKEEKQPTSTRNLSLH